MTRRHLFRWLTGAIALPSAFAWAPKTPSVPMVAMLTQPEPEHADPREAMYAEWTPGTPLAPGDVVIRNGIAVYVAAGAAHA